jgi:hypothetical protein
MGGRYDSSLLVVVAVVVIIVVVVVVVIFIVVVVVIIIVVVFVVVVSNLPVFLFLWLTSSSSRAATDCLLVSVDYQLAPDKKWPFQLHECYYIYNWLMEECPLGMRGGGEADAVSCL